MNYLNLFAISTLISIASCNSPSNQNETTSTEVQDTTQQEPLALVEEVVEIAYPEYIPFSESFTQERIDYYDSIKKINDGKKSSFYKYDAKQSMNYVQGETEEALEMYFYNEAILVKIYRYIGNSEFVIYFLDSNLKENPQPFYVQHNFSEYIEGSRVSTDEIAHYYIHNGRLLALFNEEVRVEDLKVLAKEQAGIIQIANQLASRVVYSKIKDFSGIYEDPSNNDDYQFTLTLTQIGNSIKGFYCGYSGGRVDCGVAQQSNQVCDVYGEALNDGTAEVFFNACYAGQTGEALLSFESGKLRIQTTKGVTDFCTVPDDSKLIRKNKN